MPRRFPIAQFPNPPMIVAMLAAAAARSADGSSARYAELLSRLALLVWGYEEITDGANWFRRSLGVAAAVYSIGMLARTRPSQPTT